MASSANLGQHLEDYVTELVKTGRYGSHSEVLREGVRLIEEREKRLAVLDAAIVRGIADLEAGRVTNSQQVRDELVAKYRALATARK